MGTLDQNPISLIYKKVPLHQAHCEIRVLTLQPGNWNDPIFCTLVAVSLDKHPDYYALSYSWGRGKPTETILVNDKHFAVSKHLHSILQRLRRPTNGEPFKIWIDAICIDQTASSSAALEEKSSQIKLMAIIYSQCREVLVWLGDCYKDRHEPVRMFSRHHDNTELLKEYAEDFKRNAEDLDYCFHVACFFVLWKNPGKRVGMEHYELPPFWGDGRKGRLAKCGIPPTTDQFKECYAERMYWLVRHISAAEWSTRMWTLQEFAVAPRVTVCFGTAAVPLEKFSGALFKETNSFCDGKVGHIFWALRLSSRLSAIRDDFHWHQTVRNFSGTFRPWVKTMRTPGSRASMFKPAVSWITTTIIRHNAQTVFEYCATYKGMQATKAQDKILPISTFMAFVGIDVPIEPNYDDNRVEELYIAVSKDQILNCKGHPEAYETLAPLRFCRDKNHYKNLPSWVVDWTSYPWKDNHIIPAYSKREKLDPAAFPWLQIISSAENDENEDKDKVEVEVGIPRTVDIPQRMTGATKYDAAKGLKGIAPEISASLLLSVSGVCIGKVQEVAPVRETHGWALANGWPSRNNAVDRALQERRAALLRTLTADMLEKPIDWARLAGTWPKMVSRISLMVDQLVEDRKQGKRTGPITLSDAIIRAQEWVRVWYSRAEEAAKDNIDAPLLDRIEDLLTWVRIMSSGNSFFITDTGHIGLGGKEIGIGDEVYVLHQGRTPFVLRPKQNLSTRFTVVSECYVDGLMYGEVAHRATTLKRIEIQ